MMNVQVLIVGAGPSGLMMAITLAKHHIPFKIIDKKPGITAYSKALGMQPRTLEIMRIFKLDQELIQRGLPQTKLQFFRGIKPLVAADFSRLCTAYPFILAIPQSETEAVFEEALKKQDIKVQWNTELTEIEQDRSGVTVILKSNNHIFKERYAYVIGCDGIHSSVRNGLEISFVGEKVGEVFALADGVVEGNIDKTAPVGSIAENQDGMVLMLPLPHGRTRVVINNCRLTRKEQLTEEFFNSVIQKRLASFLVVKNISWSSIFTIEYRRASRFSKGRCFLVGDAAHVHSPIGGQGMNTGIQDAYNLGWKLAFILRGIGKSCLLKTYGEEREAIAKRLLAMTHRMTTVAARSRPILNFLRPHLMYLALSTKWMHHFIVSTVSQLRINYRGMKLSKNYLSCPFTSFGQSFAEAPKAGERVIDAQVEWAKDSSVNTLYDYLDPSFFHILLFTTEALVKYHKSYSELLNIRARPGCKLTLVTLAFNMSNVPSKWQGDVLLDKGGELHRIYGALKPATYIIRPDQYIGMKAPGISSTRIEKYLSQSLCS